MTAILFDDDHIAWIVNEVQRAEPAIERLMSALDEIPDTPEGDTLLSLAAEAFERGERKCAAGRIKARALMVERVRRRGQDTGRRDVTAQLRHLASEQNIGYSTLMGDALIAQRLPFDLIEQSPVKDVSTLAAIARAPDPLDMLKDVETDLLAGVPVSVRRVEERVAQRRVAAPQVSYGGTRAARACAIAYAWPHWSYDAVAQGQLCALPLHKWLLPDALLFLRAPSWAVALALHTLGAWGLRYLSVVTLSSARPYRDKLGQHEEEYLVVGQRGRLTPPDPLPARRYSGASVHALLETLFPQYAPKLDLCSHEMSGRPPAGWLRPLAGDLAEPAVDDPEAAPMV